MKVLRAIGAGVETTFWLFLAALMGLVWCLGIGATVFAALFFFTGVDAMTSAIVGGLAAVGAAIVGLAK